MLHMHFFIFQESFECYYFILWSSTTLNIMEKRDSDSLNDSADSASTEEADQKTTSLNNFKSHQRARVSGWIQIIPV